MKAPDFWYQPNCVKSRLLSPFGQIYRAAGIVRRAIYKPYKSLAPVICVGNIVAGGAGKTPTAIALAKILQQLGANPAFVSRGYKGTEKGPLLVNPKIHTANEVGDEALILARTASCWVGRDRAATVRVAEKSATHIIMDDGLQNPTVSHTASFLVIDGTVGFGNGLLIPSGPLRETLSDALKRVNAVVIIGNDKHSISEKIKVAYKALNTRHFNECGNSAACSRETKTYTQLTGENLIPVFEETTDNLMLVLPAKIQTRLPEDFSLAVPYFAFAGIGRPEKFYESCYKAGLKIVGTKDFSDHHKFSSEEISRLSTQAHSLGAQLITTEKDWVRVPEYFRTQVSVLPIELAFEDVATLTNLANNLQQSWRFD